MRCFSRRAGVATPGNAAGIAEYGYDFGTAGERLRNLERGIAVITDCWARDEPKPLGARSRS